MQGESDRSDPSPPTDRIASLAPFSSFALYCLTFNESSGYENLNHFCCILNAVFCILDAVYGILWCILFMGLQNTP